MNNPYQNLYIYYLSGVPILGPSLEKHENFLGMWVEEKEAFLFFSSPGRRIELLGWTDQYLIVHQ